MKKILITLLLVFLTSCTWNYKNWDIQKNIDSQEVQKLEKELLELEQKKAKETLEKIRLENEIASEVLENFLKSDNFNIKEEIAKTKEKYNDSLGPILEYEHEKEESEEETSTWKTESWSTLSWTLIEDNQLTIIEKTGDTDVYSWETKLVDNSKTDNLDKTSIEDTKKIEPGIKEEEKYTTQEKKWRSGTYTMYIWISDNCKWGLEMTDLENNKKWLFENSCEKMIYNFELAVWGIKVYYNDPQWIQKNEFVSIK